MGKYFGREPRYSREEIERQAQETIDAVVSRGRPPAEDWLPLEARLAEFDRAVAAAPTMAVESQPMQLHQVRVPKMAVVAGSVVPAAPRPVARRRSVAAQPAAD